MRTLILITFLIGSSFATKCLSDIASATVSIGKASSNIADAIYECPNKAKKAGCASDISLAVTNLGEASQAIDAAVTDCSGGKKNSTCANDLTSIATALGKTGTDVTNAVQDCQKFDLKCTLDITGASIELVTITKNIIHATSDCKSMFVEPSQQSLSSSTLVEQIHLSYGDVENTMFVSWSTPTKTQSIVSYHPLNLPSNTTTTTGTSTHFQQLLNSSYPLKKCTTCVNEYLHTTLLTNLQPNQKYSYQINNTSKWFTFNNIQRDQTTLNKPYTFGVFGDMGTVIPSTPPGQVSPSLKYLQQEVLNNQIDGILHVGDLAYDMKDHGGITGAEFMRQIQPIAARVPYMTVPGNHEGGTPYTGSLHHYVNRLHMPNYNSGKNSFYSFNVGPVHIISFSSEAYYWQYWQIEKQWKWLNDDLKKVNRTQTPFIVTQAHRPMYCSSNDDHDDCHSNKNKLRKGLSGLGLFALEPLFMKYHVDLCFWAHEHSYERLWPVYEEKVMNGSMGTPYTNALVSLLLLKSLLFFDSNL